MTINLTSDTVTKPSPGMLEAMMQAVVGDDVFRADPTVNALEARGADLFGKEAALFCPSGTMTNQIAMNLHTEPLDEVICHRLSHVYQSEAGAYAMHSGLAMHLIEGAGGKITAEQVREAVQPRFDWTTRSKVVVIENTGNITGGTIYRLEEIRPIREVCRAHGLRMHLDGARLFNALVETGESPAEYGKIFDSISVCLSKGLGAPVGSLLLGEREFIDRARRLRKALGGGMRQAGYLAAAGIYALDHHVDRLLEDHRRARALGEAVARIPYVTNIRPVQTNILIFDLVPPHTAESFLESLREKDIHAIAFGPQTVRLTTHLDFTEGMLEKVLQVLKELSQQPDK